jgi:hypothetical protein
VNEESAKIAGIPPQQAKIGLAGDPGCQKSPKLNLAKESAIKKTEI